MPPVLIWNTLAVITLNKNTKTIYIINLVTLIFIVTIFILLACFDITIKYRAFKIPVFLLFISTTFIGLIQEISNRTRYLFRYYLGVILTPFLITIVTLLTGNAFAFLYFSLWFITSIFSPDQNLATKDNISIKHKYSLMTDQCFEIRDCNVIFEKKIASFYSNHNFDNTTFRIFDSVNHKYIELINNRMEKTVEQLDE